MLDLYPPCQFGVPLHLLDLVLPLLQLVLQLPVLLLEGRDKVGLEEGGALIDPGEGGRGLRDVQLQVVLGDRLDAMLVDLNAEDLDVLVPAVDFLLQESQLGLEPHVLVPQDVELHFDRTGLML